MKRRAFFALAAVVCLVSCGSVEVDSPWRTTDIAVDGKVEDWQGQLAEIKDTGVSIGVMNDAENVYVCLTATELRTAAQAFRQGVIVWVDPKGGRDKVLGIHYPLGQTWEDFQGPPEIDSMGIARKPARDSKEGLDEIEILGPGRDQKTRLRLGELKGIQVAVTRRAGVLVYEMRIPLSKSDAAPYAAESAPGQTLGIGFDAAGSEFGAPGLEDGGIPGGMGPGTMGGYGGRGGMGYPGRRMGAGASLKLWLKVRLAAQAIAR